MNMERWWKDTDRRNSIPRSKSHSWVRSITLLYSYNSWWICVCVCVCVCVCDYACYASNI